MIKIITNNIISIITITFLGTCPICGTEFKQVDSYEKREISVTSRPFPHIKNGDKNLIECQKCHVAYFVMADVKEDRLRDGN